VIREQVIFEVLGGDLSSELDGPWRRQCPATWLWQIISLFSRPSSSRCRKSERAYISFFTKPRRHRAGPKFSGGIHQATGVSNHFHQAESSDVRFSKRGFQNIRRLFADLRNAAQITSSADNKSSIRVKPACTSASACSRENARNGGD